jgi:hypothetical protein
MSRFPTTLLAGFAACALIAATPPPGNPSHATKPEAHAKARAAVHVKTERPARRVTTHEPAHATTHATVRTYQSSHHGVTSFSRERHEREERPVVITHTTFVRVEDESSTRLREMAHTPTRIARVKLERSMVRTIVTRRPALTNVTFVTGTIVSRQSNTIVLRTPTASTVTVLTQSVAVAPTLLTTGSAVVVPVRYVNNALVLVPAYTPAYQTALANGPMLAPCAVNDNDADDAGDTSYYAPPGACLNNDGDADDGYNFTVPALPNSFGPVPQAFSPAFAPAVVAGYVVAQTGSNVVLLTPDFKPLVVNAGPALSSGTMGGSLTPGRYVVAYGYDFNDTFVATSLM